MKIDHKYKISNANIWDMAWHATHTVFRRHFAGFCVTANLDLECL